MLWNSSLLSLCCLKLVKTYLKSKNMQSGWSLGVILGVLGFVLLLLCVRTTENRLLFACFCYFVGSTLGPSRVLLLPLWALVWPSSGHFGVSWGQLGAILGHLGANLGPTWGHLVAILGHLGAILGPSKIRKNPMEIEAPSQVSPPPLTCNSLDFRC